MDLKALDLLETVQAIIEQDPALAAHVVHVANSAAFAGRDPIAALGPAIKRIGAALVVGNAIQSVVNGIFDPYGGMGRRLGQIAVLEANIMAALATTWESRLHIPPEVAYAHGLLHDLGHLVMALKLGKDLDAFELRQIPPSELAQREIETFGFDHQQAGRLLANHWKLPDELTVVIASHHYPRELRVGQHDSTNATIDLLLITDRLSRLMVQNVERRAAMEAAIAEWLGTRECAIVLGLAPLPGAVGIDMSRVATRLGRNMPVILGREVFEELVVDLDYPRSRLAFHASPTFSYAGPGRTVPIFRTGPGPRLIEVGVEGHPPAKFTIDTGSGNSIDLFKRFWQERRLLDGRLPTSTRQWGGVGGKIVSNVGTLRSVTLAGYELRNVPASFADEAKGDAFDVDWSSGNLGAQIFSRFRFILDYTRERAHLEPGPDCSDTPVPQGPVRLSGSPRRRRHQSDLRVAAQPGREGWLGGRASDQGRERPRGIRPELARGSSPVDRPSQWAPRSRSRTATGACESSSPPTTTDRESGRRGGVSHKFESRNRVGPSGAQAGPKDRLPRRVRPRSGASPVYGTGPGRCSRCSHPLPARPAVVASRRPARAPNTATGRVSTCDSPHVNLRRRASGWRTEHSIISVKPFISDQLRESRNAKRSATR